VVHRQEGRQGGPAGNLYPTKQRPEQKTDAAVALRMAAGRAMAEDAR
jgi:phage terminase large subunit-like protein